VTHYHIPWKKACGFFIPGVPAPGGSKTAIPMRDKMGGLIIKRTKTGRPMPILRIIDAAKGNQKWKKIVAAHARRNWNEQPIYDVPLVVSLCFVLTHPKSHYRTGKFAHLLKDDAPLQPVFKPDRTKLARSTEDALTGILWGDDAQIVGGVVQKMYGKEPGCFVDVFVPDESVSNRNNQVESKTDRQTRSFLETSSIENTKKVCSFLCQNPTLLPLLIDLRPHVARHFGVRTSVVLEIVNEPEISDGGQLVVYIQSNLPADEGLACLNALDQDWWLKASSFADGKICLHLTTQLKLV